MQVKAIIHPHGKCRPGSPALVLEEGSIYRIDDKHIIDKFIIKSINEADEGVDIVITDKVRFLEVIC